MPSINADDLKASGICLIETALTDNSEVVITVQGINRYVVMPLERYQYLRECELESAIAQSTADLAAGRAVTSSPTDHLKRLQER